MEVKPGYKQTDVGVIPEDWEVCQVRQKGEVVTGKALAVNAPGPKRPYLRTKNVFDGRIDIDDVLTMPMTDEQFGQFRLRTGDVLLNEGQSLELIGRCAIYKDEYPEPCAIQNALLRFRASAGVSETFASYLFRHCQQTGVFARIALQTTSVAHLGSSRFERLCLAWPKAEAEQHAIATTLSDMDALLGELNRLVAKKRQIKHGAMQELLTGQKRLPGFTGKWEAKRLGEVGTFLKGSGVTKLQAMSGELRCIRYGELYTRHNDYIKEFFSFISLVVALTATPLKRGDILFAGSGETKEEIGKCAALIHEVEAYAGGDIVILRTEGADPLFLGYYLNTPTIARQKASRGQGDAVVHIGSSALAAVQTKLPKPDEQSAIASILSDMDADIAGLEAKLAKARLVKAGMMQELLTGKTRLVKPREAAP